MNLFKGSKLNRERGSATIEAIISFTGFLFVIFTILNVVNYCRAQMLISNAVDTATKELTQYAYFYKMSGLQGFSEDIYSNADQGATNINDILGTTDKLYQSLGTAVDNTASHVTNIYNAIEDGNYNQDQIQNILTGIQTDATNIDTSITTVMDAFGSVQSNPMLYMKSIVAIAGGEALDTLKSHVIAAPLAKLFTAKHFGTTTEEANRRLIGLGVVDGLNGMNFNMSTIFSSDAPGDVHIVVYYKLKLVQVFDWASLEVVMCKESVARAWLGGDEVVKKESSTESSSETNTTEEIPETQTTEETKDTQVAENTEETEMTEDENVDTTGSYWHLDSAEKGIAINQGIYGNDIGVDVLHHISYTNGVIMMSTEDALKADRPTQLFQSYTITEAKNDTSDYMVSCIWNGLKSIYMNLEVYDGEEKIERTLYYTVYVPENISEEDYEKLEAEIKQAEMTLEIYKNADEGGSSDFEVAKNADYEIKIVKAGGNYDYGSGE